MINGDSLFLVIVVRRTYDPNSYYALHTPECKKSEHVCLRKGFREAVQANDELVGLARTPNYVTAAAA